jgi:phosphohistidine swiveling domain-containing protein
LFKRIAALGGSGQWRDCFYLLPSEMIALVAGEKVSIPDIVSKRAEAGYYMNSQGEVQPLDEKTVHSLAQYIRSLHGKSSGAVFSQATAVKGFSANKGVVRGHAKIVLGVRDFGKFSAGDVLIASMTSVDYVPIMKQAAAFVTNEGGVTSHASIVAREMQKPCVIGTKIATQVFKDGDLIEVDADRGIVRKV